MKFSYNWLNQYFDGKLPSPEDVAEKVGLHSFELEGIEKLDNGDSLIDWDILPNRSSDCLCYDGIVKEISAVLNMTAKDVLFRTEGVEFDKDLKTSDFVTLKVNDNKKVLRATKRIAINVEVGSSPQWLVDSLEAMGQKSINNVVDITNYVMFVTGQPVHAFDYDKLAGSDNKNIYIREANDGEELIDLTGEKHILDSSMLVVADDEKALDIAGIKGGNVSGVDLKTKRILMSAVNFEYESIRNTSRKLKLATDASKRYENEVPLCKVDLAMKQFSYLLKELAGAKVAEEIIDSHPKIEAKKEIRVALKDIKSVLGIDIDKKTVESIFDRLKFKSKIEEYIFLVTPLAERLDINIKEDLIEEVGRIYGYENILEQFPSERFKIAQKNILKNSINKVSDFLVSSGFFEVYNRSIVKDGEIKLANSLNANATTLRKSLLNLLEKKAEKNFVHCNEPKMFEIGKIFTGVKEGKVEEHYSFAGIIGRKKIKEKQKEDLFYLTKGYLEKVFKILFIKNAEWKKTDDKGFIADVYCKDVLIGQVGINFWEINFEKLIKNINESIEYKKVSKYPKISRDVAFWTEMNVKKNEVEKIIKSILPEEAVNLELFDIYKDAENNRKSFAFGIDFQSIEKTLSDKFVNEIMEKVYKILENNGFETR